MTGEIFHPRGAVKVNGETVPGWVWFETEANEFYAPDTFRINWALSALPKDHDVAWFSSQGTLDLELFAGFVDDPDKVQTEELQSIFAGRVDVVSLDYGDLTMELVGRDLTAPFVDNKSSEKYVNLTSSQVAEKLAGKYGLEAKVEATTAKVGTFYATDHVDLQSDRTEWDLLTWLARKEGFRVYVKGKTLYFQAPPASNERPYVFERTTSADGPDGWNGQSVRVNRTLTVARDIEVTVTSWSTKQKKAYSRKARRSKLQGGGAIAQKYSYRIPNLTPEEAQQRANQLLAELSRHEMKLEVEGPADTTMAIDSVIQVRGTGTDFDQTYFPSSIVRRLSVDGGFGWSISAKNHSPESEATI